MNFLLLTALIFSALGAMFSFTRQLQMLQQNSYFPSRYTGWLKANFPYSDIFLYFLISLLFCLKLYVLMAVLCGAILVYKILEAVRIQKKSIKKLVFTGRIKRLYSAPTLLLVLLIIGFILLRGTFFEKLCSALILFFSFVTPLLTYFSWAVTLPIEKAFTGWYVNDAKRILNEHKSLKVIGITGSYGKTTTKFILTRILSEKFNTVCTPQSFNTPMGVVRTIREHLKPQTQIFVCEMGAKNKGDIKEICDIVNPDYGVITSVGAQHLDTFKSIDNVFNTKFELADAVMQKQGKIFVNGDSEELKKRLNKDGYTVYGTDNSFKYTAENISYGRNGSEFDVNLGDSVVHLTSRLLGLHSIINIIGAVGLAYELGISAEDLKFAVASLKPTEHRLEMKNSIAGSIMIDDAYNANPEGSIEAVRVLGSFDGMQKVIITPGLIELGEQEYDCNFRLGLETANKCDIIIFVGENRSKPLVDAVNTTDFDKSRMFVAKSFRDAMDIYSRFADSNTVLLIENDLPDNYLN